MTIKALLQWGMQELVGIDSGLLDAELLLAWTLQKDRTYLMAHDQDEVSWHSAWCFRRLVKKRKKYFPVSYLLGKKEFFGMEFEVNRHVLIPRPDTEVLVEAVLDYLKPNDLLLDVGTGSGCIPIVLLKNKPELLAVATDVSSGALKLAQRNATRHGVGERLQLCKADLVKGISQRIFGEHEIVVTANLPYVPLDYQINQEARYEPSLALFSENDGVALYQRLLDQLKPIKPRAIFLECYDFQKAILTDHMQGYHLKKQKSMLGKARMLMLERLT